MFRKVLRILGLIGLGVFLALLLLEWAYRSYWFDFYRVELEYLTPAEDLKPNKEKKTVLVLGDSFSVGPDNYVDQLRERMPEYRFVNAAVPGTGLIQAGIILEDRIEEFQPDVVIYQMYPANDLMDWEYPVSGEGLSFGRKIYWWLANRFRSLAWLNYKFGQRLRGGTVATLKDHEEGFDPAKYNSRERLYFTIAPYLIGASTGNISTWKERYNGYRSYYQELFQAVCDKKTPVITLIVPHCAQVSREYQNRMKQVGARFEQPDWLLSPDYPFQLMINQGMGNAQPLILNPLAAFQCAEEEGTALYFTHDPHLNREGHRVLTDLLTQQLKKLK